MSIKKPKKKAKHATAISKSLLRCLERGWALFPIYGVHPDGCCRCTRNNCPEGDHGKHPIPPDGFKSASKDPAQIREWLKQYPDCNWAVATGKISGLTVVDVDMGVGKVGEVTWAALIAEYGEPVTLMARTGGGGLHALFQYTDALKTGNDRLGTHVDVKNDGGYVLVCPSGHRSGGCYEWLDWSVAVGPLPAYLGVKKETRGRPRKGEEKRTKFSLEEVASALTVVPSDNRDFWHRVGIILGRTFHQSDAAWAVYRAWADTYTGVRKANHEQTMHEAFYVLSLARVEHAVSVGSIIHEATKHGWAPLKGRVPIDRFVYLGNGNSYLYRPTADEWIAHAVDAACSPINVGGVLVKASVWLQEHQLCTSMTCDPDLEGDFIQGVDCRNGEIIDMPESAVFNKYRGPTITGGDALKAGPFVDHVALVFNKEGDATQFVSYMAHRVQRPGEKPRFALLIGGPSGDGKDTCVEFCVPAIGSWNVAPIDPSAFLSSFNEYAEATLIRISETSNLHEMSKWAFNERTKVLIAGRPDYCVINPKCLQKYSVRMFCGVVMTTNHLLTGIFISPDDRRYDVIDAATLREMGLEDEGVRKKYFDDLWEWFVNGGDAHVAAYLQSYDIREWNPNAPRKTLAHRSVVSEGRTTDLWLVDIIEEFGNPEVMRADWIIHKAVESGLTLELAASKLRQSIGRMDYQKYRNPANKDDRWTFIDKNKCKKGRVIYVRVGSNLSEKQILDLAAVERF